MANSVLTPERIRQNTYWAERHAVDMQKRFDRYKADSEKESRLKARLCRTCYYIRSGMVGHAFTAYTCRECRSEKMHPNTDTPRYCQACSDQHCACQKCGADLEKVDQAPPAKKEQQKLVIKEGDIPNWKRRTARYGFQCQQCKENKSLVVGDSRQADGTLVIHTTTKDELAYYQRGKGKKICQACYEAAVKAGER